MCLHSKMKLGTGMDDMVQVSIHIWLTDWFMWIGTVWAEQWAIWAVWAVNERSERSELNNGGYGWWLCSMFHLHCSAQTVPIHINQSVNHMWMETCTISSIPDPNFIGIEDESKHSSMGDCEIEHKEKCHPVHNTWRANSLNMMTLRWPIYHTDVFMALTTK